MSKLLIPTEDPASEGREQTTAEGFSEPENQDRQPKSRDRMPVNEHSKTETEDLSSDRQDRPSKRQRRGSKSPNHSPESEDRAASPNSGNGSGAGPAYPNAASVAEASATQPRIEGRPPLMHRLFPNLPLSVTLLLLWLLLNNSLSAGNIVLGVLLGLLIPQSTAGLQRFRPVQRYSLALKYTIVLLRDIIVSNIEVAIQVLGPLQKLTPGFIAIPLDLTSDLPITLLASSISLTPGTVSVEVSKDHRWLYVHVLNITDPEESIQTIKERYERPLKEIFAC